MPKVSIVLPTYNGEKYLQQSVDSILAQTYMDWELIIVDDCSTDATGMISDGYCKIDSRIRVIHNVQNQQLPRSLNIGFDVAKGQYLTWTSDDNMYLMNALEVMVHFLDEHSDVYMVRGSMYYIDNAGCIIGQSENYCDEKMYEFNCLGACFLYRKEVRDKIGNYNTEAFCVEDYEYWLRVLEHFGRIASIGEILYQYRRHENSLSETKRKQVTDQLTKLRIHYLNRIFEILGGKKDVLCRIYYEMRQSTNMTLEAEERFKQIIPELRWEVKNTDKKYIIFGAGKYGERAAAALGSQAAFFADSDSAKTGMMKCGLEILAFYDAVEIADNYCFLIAVAREKIYEMVLQLKVAGIKSFRVFLQ